MPEQKNLLFWNNQNLFSNNYLEHRLPSTDLWTNQREPAEKVFEVIKESYQSIHGLNPGPGEETVLEDKFIQPVLSSLGYTFHPQPRTQRGYKKKRPDYALFKDTNSYKQARKFKDDYKKFFSGVLTILEAKYWGRRLNDTDKNDILDSRDPTAQTVKYLDDVYFHTDGRINWAILTNGKIWRLFYYRAASRSGNFYEVNLENIIKSGNPDSFLYFYLFFSKNAFVPDSLTGKTWLDHHLKGTEEYAVRVSSKLKDLIFDKVFEGLAEGFVHYRRTDRSIHNETDESRKDIFKGCLTLLYRLLFLLYAESRKLLPVDEDAYHNVSLLKLKKDIFEDLSAVGMDKMSKRSYSYWSRLESLFDIIAKGDPALNVPVYNGGLFETPKDSFLITHKMPDPFLAEAIELLTVDHEGEYRPGTIPFIDYSSLNVRHLGDIYEGLLEFHIRIADEDIVAVRKGGKSLWLKASEVKEGTADIITPSPHPSPQGRGDMSDSSLSPGGRGQGRGGTYGRTKIYAKKSEGDVFIENSKHERKATGSYYTPHYIVEYIVKNTVGPVLDERLKTVETLMMQLEDSVRTLRKQKSASGVQGCRLRIREIEDSIFNTLFDIKVLDPAMGSGHFLVHSVDFISDRIVSFLANYPDNPVIRKIEELKKEILEEIKRQGVRIDESKLTEVNLVKRMVMKRCIYGVDLNDMAVELAKLSLWLDSFTLGAPLSFLDHHLKCGNSLIGIFDISDVVLPGSEAYGKVQRALSFMLQVSELTDATISEAQKSYDLFENARREIEPIRRRFDVATARYFADLGTSFGRVEQLAYTLDYDNEPYPEIIEKCKTALSLAEQKKFFHWRIEFPEVFYSEKGEKENPGFDCVIGNPPYVRIQKQEDDSDKKYLKTYQTPHKNYDIYVPFVEKGISLLNRKGQFCYIMPNKFLQAEYGEKLRHLLASKKLLKSIVNFGHNQIFAGEATTYTCLLFLYAAGQEIFNYIEFQSLTDPNHKIPAILLNPFDDRARSEQFLIESFGHSSWIFGLGTEKQLLQKISKKSQPLRELVEQIIVGVQTSADSVYVLKNIRDDRMNRISCYTTSLDGDIPLERNLLKPLLSGINIARYESIEPFNMLLFPYQIDTSGAVKLIPEQQLNKELPLTWEYLRKNKGLLRNRENRKFDDVAWYRFGRHQNLDKQENLKVAVPRLIDRLKAFYDEKGEFYLDNVDVNGILFKSDSSYAHKYILALLNSKLMDFIFKKGSAKFRGNYYSANKQFISPLPIAIISFTTPKQERKERVDKAVELYQTELKAIATEDIKWHNKEKEDKNEKGRNKKGPAKSRKMAGKQQGYTISEEGISRKGAGLGGEVHGIREGTGKYGPPEGTPQEAGDSTRPLDSTRHFETARGILTYTEVFEIIAVSVKRTIEDIINHTPDDIRITPEWICKLHDDVAGSLFPDWAGRFRDINVVVGTHAPPPYYEVPVHLRLYCEDLAARLSFSLKESNIEKISETLAYADWRFQWIHPFRDFNGRIGRIILAAVLFKLKLPPAEIAAVEPHERKEYLSALRVADTGDISPLAEIWIKRLSKAVEDAEDK